MQALVERSGPGGPTVWISNRSGAFPDAVFGRIKVTTDNQALVAACNVVVLSVPPALVSTLNIVAKDRLVVSVMAGITIAQIKALTGANRVVRAMSSPAAAQGLAHSPWMASTEVTERDRQWLRALFDPCGMTDELQDEAGIDVFTVLTGPAPGFIAYFAACMADYAMANKISPEVANRAVRQLFLSAGTLMAASDALPQDHVRQMIDYRGTTAAGLHAMIEAKVADGIAQGLDAACLGMLNDLAYRFFDEDEAAHVVDNATPRPSVDHACINVSPDASMSEAMLL
ncbi:MAG: pyrroline-5-carboxylate reductase family protein [Cypionkella sp.]